MLIFVHDGEQTPFHQESFKQGVTFEWVKNKIAEKMEANY
jgi:hypothetical protein